MTVTTLLFFGKGGTIADINLIAAFFPPPAFPCEATTYNVAFGLGIFLKLILKLPRLPVFVEAKWQPGRPFAKAS